MKKSALRAKLGLFLALCLLVGLLPMQIARAAVVEPTWGATVSVADEAQLRAAITAAGSTVTQILITKDIYLTTGTPLEIRPENIIKIMGSGDVRKIDGSAQSCRVLNNNGNLYLEESYITGGSEVSDNGGGIYNSTTGELYLLTNAVVMKNAALNGGGVANQGLLVLDGGEISDNAAMGNGLTGNGNGAGVYMDQGSFTMIGGSICYNATSGTPAGDNTSGYGGGVYVCGAGQVSVDNCDIYSNYATHSGGGIYKTSSAALTLSGRLLFEENTAGVHGGAIYLEGLGVGTSLTVPSRAQFANNTAGQDGGGIWIAYSDLAKLNVEAGATFTDNSAQAAYTRNAADDATYSAHVLGTSWTSPLTQGYNNYDIAYTRDVNYPLMYALDGGTNAAGNPASYSVANLPITIDPPTKDGYSFEGWTVDYANTAITDLTTSITSYAIPTTATGSITLTAHWRVNYSITYALDGGTNAAGNPARYSDLSTFPISIGNPTKGGYTFEGWAVDYADPLITDLTNAKNYEIPAGTTGNITLTAQWKKRGVIGGGGDDSTPEPSPSATPEP
ncbi:MAG: InlB B-repeat-containing protein, partial [Christensenellaceae bacterium]|nr:InlB B-repeat-containing protein [Christensenellaceae bacterium]